MLFYYDLLDSTIIVMSSLFGIVNSIRPFCILLCIYTFYYVLYSAILAWRFRLRWWRFALSIWQCKVLYPIVQLYILLYTYVCYHPRLGYFRNFCSLFCVPVLWSVSSCESKLYYAYVISCVALSGQKLDDRAGGNGYRSKPRCHFLPSAVKMADNVDKTDRKEDERWSRFKAFKGGKRVTFWFLKR